MDPIRNGRETSAVSVRARFKTSKNSQRVYPTDGFLATDNLGPGTALIPLTQGRFAFVDSSEPFGDPRIAGYLQFLSSELSDDRLRNFLRARYAYSVFQRLGTPESRRYAWSEIQLACRLSAKSSHGGIAVTPGNAILGQRGKQIIPEGRQ